MMRRYRSLPALLATLVVAAAACCLQAGCRKPQAAMSPPVNPATGVQGEMRVFVPCGIAGPFGQIRDLFEQRYPNCKVKIDLANIDVQTKILVDGKDTPDLWMALGDKEMGRVLAAERVDGEPATYAYNSVAFVVKKNNPCGIEQVTDLTKKEVKTIAIPTPENSSGFYMQAALEKAGVWEQVQSKLWVTPEPAQVKTQLSSGKAEVGVVYYPCARETSILGGKQTEMSGKVQLLGKIPAELSGQIPAQAAVIKGAANPGAARAFLAFLLEDPVQDIWENWAFERAKEPSTGPRTTVYLYAGAGLRPMLDAATEAFKQQRPNIRIDIGYAGSGCLLSQLAFSKRGDLYMPGEDYYISQAVERGYITSQKPIGYFEPVLLVQKGNPKAIAGVQDLTRSGMEVGLGEPEACAVGRAADVLLNNAGVLKQVQPNVRFRGGNVPELGNMVKLKQLDVSVVWNLTAAQYPDDCDVVPVDKALYKPSLAPIGLLKFTQHQPEAQAFIDFLTGPEGQKIVKDSGMTPAAASGS